MEIKSDEMDTPVDIARRCKQQVGTPCALVVDECPRSTARLRGGMSWTARALHRRCMTTSSYSNARKEKPNWNFSNAGINALIILVLADQNAHTYTPATIQMFVFSHAYFEAVFETSWRWLASHCPSANSIVRRLPLSCGGKATRCPARVRSSHVNRWKV